MRRLLLTLVAALLVLTPHTHEARATGGLGPVTQSAVTAVTSPGDTADMAMWLRADQVVSPTNGAKFSQWLDLANGGATYTQATSANQSVWNASDVSFNGQPSVTSNIAAFMTTTASVTCTSPFTVYFAGISTSLSSYQIVVGTSGDKIEAGYLTSSYYEYPPAGKPASNSAGAHAVAYVFNGASSIIYADSSAASKGSAFTTSPTACTTLTLGYTVGTDGFVGNIAEILVYKVAHSTAQIGAVFSYMGQRYGHVWH